MVGHQNVGEPPPCVGQSLVDGFGLGRIDRGRRTGRRVVQQNAVIVLQAGEEGGLGRHGWLATPAGRRQASTAFIDVIRNLKPVPLTIAWFYKTTRSDRPVSRRR